MSEGFRFKLKEKIDAKEDNNAPKSKYFKPGFLLGSDNTDQNVIVTKSNTKDAVTKEVGDVDDELDRLLVEASQEYSQSTSSTQNQATTSNCLSIESQSVDFTSQNRATIPSLKNTCTILVNPNQQQNPLLKNLRSLRYIITDTISPAHYVLFDSCCALFLSLKYHVINSEYIYERINELKSNYQLKILLLLIDHVVYEQCLKELTVLAIRTNFTLLVAWNYEEAARHIENYRLNADKPPDIIRNRSNDNTTGASNKSSSFTMLANHQSLVDALTNVKAVNRTDAVTLLSTFEKFDNIVNASVDELTICPGISMVKARRLHQFCHKPFLKDKQNTID